MAIMRPETKLNIDDFFFNPFIGYTKELAQKTIKQSYPRYNLISTDSGYLLEISAIGLDKEDIEVKFKSGVLSIKSDKKEPRDGDYIEKGISGKAFELLFNVASSLKVNDIKLDKGILTIEMVKEKEDEYLLEIK